MALLTPEIILASLLPTLLWLLFYLHYDKREPEPKKEVLRSFFLGALMVLPTYFLEDQGTKILHKSFPSTKDLLLLEVAFIFPWLEEFLKFLGSYLSLFKSEEITEPIDIIIYMISSGLGFAFGENIIKLLGVYPLGMILTVSFLRSITSVFLHSLTMAFWGLFLVYSFYLVGRKRRVWQGLGFLLAVSLHSLYNLTVFQTTNHPVILLPLLSGLLFLGVFLIIKLKKLKKEKGVCYVY